MARQDAQSVGRLRAPPTGRRLRGRRALMVGSLAAASGLLLPASIGLGVLSSAAGAQARPEVRVGVPAPDISFSTADGAQHQLSQYRGRPVMLWLFATWCPTCYAGTTAVAQVFDRLQLSGLQIIQLKLYGNLGYPGPSVEEFARDYAGEAYPSPGWIWGEASLEASFTYDPRGYPDIYFLIDGDGIVREINTAPNVTLDTILGFTRAG